MALYPKAIKRLIPLDTKKDPAIKARVVILHVAATEAASLAPYFTSGSGGVESHFYVRYDGSVEQYRDTAYQADANVMANGFAISIETQGLADGKWTDAQLGTIKALLAWCHTTHGIPLVVCPRWDGSGVGYHILFEDQWDQRHASCPGPNRINQFKSVLVPWMAAGGSEDDMPTPAEFWGYKAPGETKDAYEYLRNEVASRAADLVVQRLLAADVIPAPVKQDGNPTWTVGASLEWTGKGVAAIQAALNPAQIAAAVVAAMPEGKTATQADVETALRNVLGSLDNKE